MEMMCHKMGIEHSCGNMAYRLSYQKKISSETSPKYYKTSRYFCPECDVIIRLTEGE